MGFYFFGRQNKDDGFLFGERLARTDDAWNIAAYETWVIGESSPEPGFVSCYIPRILGPGQAFSKQKTIIIIVTAEKVEAQIGYAWNRPGNIAFNIAFVRGTQFIHARESLVIAAYPIAGVCG